MQIVATVAGLRDAITQHGKVSLGFVPTMGALHDGHISLVSRARNENDYVIVSVFVNPTQFNDPEDLQNYPRTPERDLEMLEKAGADIVFMPSVQEMYPEADIRVFDFGEIDKVMEGVTRPGHFNGVAQVVSRLFDMVRPDKAYFGEKDFQQIAVIKALVAQSELKPVIVECPIVRESDGLAMSSRNALLTPAHRMAAPAIYEALQKGVAAKKTMTVGDVVRMVTQEVENSPLLKVIYFNIVDGDTLQSISDWSDSQNPRGCIAVQAGGVRLIDNIGFRQ